MLPNLFYASQSDIDRITGQIAGAYSRLLFCPEELVDFTTNYPGYFAANPATGMLDQELIQSTIAPDFSFFQALVPNSRKGYTEEVKTEEGGPFIAVNVQAFIPFGSSNTHLQLDRMKYQRFILLVERSDGSVRVVGNKGNGARMTFVEDFGESPKMVPGTTVRFTCEMLDKPMLYTQALPL